MPTIWRLVVSCVLLTRLNQPAVRQEPLKTVHVLDFHVIDVVHFVSANSEEHHKIPMPRKAEDQPDNCADDEQDTCRPIPRHDVADTCHQGRVTMMFDVFVAHAEKLARCAVRVFKPMKEPCQKVGKQNDQDELPDQ